MRLLCAALLCVVAEGNGIQQAYPLPHGFAQGQNVRLGPSNAIPIVTGSSQAAATAVAAAPSVGDGVADVSRLSGTQTRITSGANAEPGEFLWIAAVVLRDQDFVFCSATVISEYWLLTAAHCFAPYKANEVDILVGKQLRDADPNQVRRQVVEIIAHPSNVAYRFKNDVALIRVGQSLYPAAQAISLPQTICTINIPDSCLVGVTATIVGWGLLQGDTFILPTELQKAEVPIIDNRNCQRRYAYLEPTPIIFDTMLCAGKEFGKVDTCQGDSGGPLVVRKGGVYTLEGVVSFGYGCGQSGYPGVYQRVASFTQWILGIVGPGVL